MFTRVVLSLSSIFVLAVLLLNSRPARVTIAAMPGDPAPQPVMLADLKQTPRGSEPYNFVVAGDVAYFSAKDAYGYELWRSDGTEAGTYRLKDIHVGEDGSYPGLFTVVGDQIFFVADGDGTVGGAAPALWRSDGTAAGTVLVKAFAPDEGGDGFPAALTALNGILYFTYGGFGYGGSAGRGLWRSDGTTAGTMPLKEAGPDFTLSLPGDLIAFNGMLYFGAEDGAHGYELWRSDGTAIGTTLFKDIWPGPESSGAGNFTEAGGVLYFGASDEAHGNALWRSNGTAETTTLVKDIAPSQNFGTIFNLISVQDTLLFWADDEMHGYELWRSDGTAAGTTLVKDIIPGPEGTDTEHYLPDEQSGTLYFVIAGSVHGGELWQSDGTEAGTALIKDINPGCTDDLSLDLAIVGDSLYFTAADDIHGCEIWRSDGTAAGTDVLVDLLPGLESSNPSGLTPLHEGLLFTAYDPVRGKELWWSGGRAEDTRLVRDLDPGTESSNPWSPTVLNGKILFFADGGITYNQVELWKSDGTNAPSRITDHLNITYPPSTFVYGDQLFFSVLYSIQFQYYQEYWRTDGTMAGTYPFPELDTHFSYIAIPSHVELNGLLYYTVYGGNYSPDLEFEFVGLFVSNGSESHRLDIHPTDISWLVTDGRNLYMSAYTPETGYELWKSDGTAEGTVLVEDINSGDEDGTPPLSSPRQTPLVLNGILYFFANNSNDGDGLWRSDGTEEGTWLVKDISPTDVTLRLSLLNATDQFLFFSLSDAEGGDDRLWRSDGTEEGTIQLQLFPNQSFENIREPTSLRTALIFVVDDGEHGAELWRSDGTLSGTKLVADIFPGATGAEPRFLTLAQNGWLYFSADDGLHGRELWQSDGTAEGTHLFADILPGPPGSRPEQFADVVLPGNAKWLLFSADDGLHDHELWALPYQPFQATAWSYLSVAIRP